ncbi:MAG: hypothetical protein M1812_005101 [Candelaria pacifica]|nr:MAG: hypothetical protein M1812_005101 [Candelaria pacifica]
MLILHLVLHITPELIPLPLRLHLAPVYLPQPLVLDQQVHLFHLYHLLKHSNPERTTSIPAWDDFSDATEIPDHQTNHSTVSEEGEEIDKDAYIQVMKEQVLKMLKEINILKADKGTTQETTQEFSDPPIYVSNPPSREPRGEPIAKFSGEAEDLDQFLEALKMNFLLRPSYYTTDSSKTITAIQALTDNAATWAYYWKFVQEMKEAFEDSQLQKHLIVKLDKLYQTTSVANLAGQLKDLLSRIGYLKTMWTDHLLKKLKPIIRQELATAVGLNCSDYDQCKHIVMTLDHSIFSANLNNKTSAQFRTPASTSNTGTTTATFTAQNNTSHPASGT